MECIGQCDTTHLSLDYFYSVLLFMQFLALCSDFIAQKKIYKKKETISLLVSLLMIVRKFCSQAFKWRIMFFLYIMLHRFSVRRFLCLIYGTLHKRRKNAEEFLMDTGSYK